jgi:outer membrane lipoprotein-sorting protein
MKSLDQTIEWLATREIDEAFTEDAQRKLETLIATRSSRTRLGRAGGWVAAAASAAAVVLVLVLLPLTPTPALAFSAVQQQLRDFRTLRFVIDQRVNGQETMKTRVAMTHDGNVRTEVGEDIAVIVNSSEKRVMTLVKPARIAMVKPLDQPVGQDDQLAWLDDIRDFQGVATRLPRSRTIEGRNAYGWQLTIGGMRIELWATEDGVPLEMKLDQGAPVQLLFHFEMNVPLPADLFSTRVPEGYNPGPPED